MINWIEVIPLVVTVGTVTSVHLAGKKDIRSWVLLVVAQSLFLGYSLLTHQWTQCSFNLTMVAVGIRNYVQWKNEKPGDIKSCDCCKGLCGVKDD